MCMFMSVSVLFVNVCDLFVCLLVFVYFLSGCINVCAKCGMCVIFSVCLCVGYCFALFVCVCVCVCLCLCVFVLVNVLFVILYKCDFV